MATKSYVDLTGLQEFLTKLKTAYAENTTSGSQFTVGQAGKLSTARTIGLSGDATGSASFDGSANVTITTTIADAVASQAGVGGSHGLMTAADKEKLNGITAGATKVEASQTNGNIKIDGVETTVYTHPAYTSATSDLYKITVDATGHVSGTTAVVKADIDSLVGVASADANGLMSSADFTKLSGIAAGAQVNVIEGVSLDGVPQTISEKVVTLDLSAYAKKKDISAVMEFKGVVDYTSDLPAASSSNTGDVYIVRYKGTSGTAPLNAEYVSTGSAWEEFGNAIALENYYTKTEVDAKDTALQGNIDAIYKAASGDDPESGVLVTKIAAEALRATTAEEALDGRLDILEGDDTTAGSVAKSIKDAIEGLDVTTVSGDYITAVGETDGKISVTAGTKGSVASGNTGLVDGGTVYAVTHALDEAKADKVTSATSGNFAGLDANGNLTDSGSKADDFVPYAIGTSADKGKILIVNNSGALELSDAPDTGVTSLAATAPLAVDRNKGAVTVSFSDQDANKVLAGPVSGSADAPNFRALVEADIPTLSAAKVQLSDATENHFATFDENGSVKDSGKAASDLENVIDSVKVNNVALAVSSKAVNVSIAPVTDSGVVVNTDNSTGAVTLAITTATDTEIDNLFA